MNEVLAVLYYVFAKDDQEMDNEGGYLLIEGDTFFCFSAIMAEIMNFFCKSLDDSNLGVKNKIKKNKKLKIKNKN